jgi:thiol:disulfide interchange protein DsbD
MRSLASRTALLLITALVAVSNAAGQDQEILRPEQAFPYTLDATADEILVRFDVPDGYYLYRERFEFASETPAVVLGAPVYPAGEIHEDEFFGVVETYRRRLEIAIPYERRAQADELLLALRVQGCADIGLCYPPQDWSRTVTLPPAADAASPIISGVFSPGAAGDDILPPEQAFVMNARVEGPNELVVAWTIEPGYYLYEDKFAFRAEGPIELGTAHLPPSEPHHDEYFGDVGVYYGYVEAAVPFSRAGPDAIDVTVVAVAQGCKIDSICYPVMEREMALTVPATSEFTPGAAVAPPALSEQDRLAAMVLSDSWWLVLGTFYGLGLLLAFTPCVLPMVPILSGIIAGQGKNVTALRGFSLSLAYVLGMALTYTAGGALAALAGEQLQATFQQPWILTVFAGLFVLLALAMFGVFELQMPSALQTRLAGVANRQTAGSYLGVAVMGALSALIVTACVAPPLVATLAVIGQAGDVTRGAGALFALSLGMGSPLLLVGASAGKLLPKAGPWMNTVKAGFGVMLLGVAIWMMERVLPGSVTLALWALLTFLTGVFLGAFEPLPAQAPARLRLGKGIGLLACLYGALMLIGASLGGADPLRPIPRAAIASGGGDPAASLAFEPVRSVAELQVALAAARDSGSPVMIDVTAEWCVSCQEMEHYTFTDPGVIAALEPYVLLQADVTENDDDDKALLRYFGSYGPPTIAFFDRSSRQQDAFKLVGFVPAGEFTEHVHRFAAL